MSEGPDISRKILNANIGMINTVEKKDIRDVMIKTFNRILDILKAHCGPFAEFAIIDDPLKGVGEPIFTTDGINIISAIEFASPMEEFVRSMVKYIGKRTEIASSDGTTSTMMITIGALSNLLNSTKNNKLVYSKLVSEYKAFEAYVLKEIEKNKYTIDKLDKSSDTPRQEIIKEIAIKQALTSSHGDYELSKLIAEMFSKIPEKAWQFVSFERERYERDWDYKLIMDDNQFTCECVIMDSKMLNANMGTAVKYKDAKLITIAQPIMESSNLFNVLMDKVNLAIEEKEPLVLLIPAGTDQRTKSTLLNILSQNPGNKVAIFQKYVENPDINELVVALLLRGISPLDVSKTYEACEGVTVSFENNILKLDGLYDNPDDSPIHPFVVDKDKFPLYEQMLEQLTLTVEKLKTESTNASTNDNIAYFQKIHNSLYLTKRACIRIGGSAHDNTAAVDKCMDTVGAVRESLRHGFTLGACCTLAQTLQHVNKRFRVFSDAFLSAIKTLHKSICRDDNVELPETNSNAQWCIDAMSPGKIREIDMKNLLKSEIPLQPASVDAAVIERFGEVALKFIHTNRVISPGTIYLDAKTQEKINDHRQ